MNALSVFILSSTWPNHHLRNRCVIWNHWISQLDNWQGQCHLCTTGRMGVPYIFVKWIKLIPYWVSLKDWRPLMKLLMKFLPLSAFQPFGLFTQLKERETGFLASHWNSHETTTLEWKCYCTISMHRMSIRSGLPGTVQIKAHCRLSINNALIDSQKYLRLDDQLYNHPNEGLQ